MDLRAGWRGGRFGGGAGGGGDESAGSGWGEVEELRWDGGTEEADEAEVGAEVGYHGGIWIWIWIWGWIWEWEGLGVLALVFVLRP